VLNRADRPFLAIGSALIVGVVCLVVGVWVELRSPDMHWAWFYPLGAGVVVALIFIGFAAVELVHRLRQGPQEPGRHTRS
jgi:hypothetical protein